MTETLQKAGDGQDKQRIGEKRRQVKRPWSEGEKATVFEYFRHHVSRGKIPGKREIDELMNKNTLIQGRTWRNIKDCVRNRIASKKIKHF